MSFWRWDQPGGWVCGLMRGESRGVGAFGDVKQIPAGVGVAGIGEPARQRRARIVRDGIDHPAEPPVASDIPQFEVGKQLVRHPIPLQPDGHDSSLDLTMSNTSAPFRK